MRCVHGKICQFIILQQIRLNASRQLEILISGEDVTDQLVSLNASISTDFYTVSRSSSNSILATFPNGMGLMVNLTNMLTFTVIIPDKYRGLTREVCKTFIACCHVNS